MPLYELGLAGGTGVIPDYPAADQSRVRSLLLPNFRYRGKYLRADEESGVRARLLRSDTVDFDLSFGGAFPVNTGENRARKGMQDLDWLVEFGPRLFVILWQEKGQGRLRAGLPIRGVFSTDGTSATHQGFVAVPGLLGEVFSWPCSGCVLYFALAPTLASEGVADYFYQVESTDVTPERERYNGKEGLIGTDLTLGLSITKGDWEYFAGTRATTHAHARNEDSPLFKKRENLSAFIAVGWLFYSSSTEGQD